MSAPAVIDSLAFARGGNTLRGSIAAKDLARLQDDLYDDVGRVDYTLSGGEDSRGRPMLRLSITGELHLRCQRCLGQLVFPVSIGNSLLIAASGSGAELDDPDEPESVEPSGELDVAALVEDELVLGLPFAPRHAEDACREPADGPGRDSGAAGPFAALAALKKNSRSKSKS